MVANNIPSSNYNGLISIIMPFKNTGIYIKECIDSIINQEYKEWELLAVDDHSDDKSTAIVKDFEIQYDNVSYLLSNGTGIIDALNTGYKHSKGMHITRMDSDDIMTPNKLRSMVNLINGGKSKTLAVGKVKYIKKGTLGAGYVSYQNWLNQLTSSGLNFEEIYKECSIPSPAWMCRRVDFEALGGFDRYVYPEDYDLAFRFRKYGMKVSGTTDVVHLWRDYQERTSRNDSNYSDGSFIDLKVSRFILDDLNTNVQLIVWGAGKKGKRVAKLLIQNKIEFRWYTDNANKIGVNIYGITLASPSYKDNGTYQVIVCVAGEMQSDIRVQIENRPNIQPYYFA